VPVDSFISVSVIGSVEFVSFCFAFQENKPLFLKTHLNIRKRFLLFVARLDNLIKKLSLKLRDLEKLT